MGGVLFQLTNQENHPIAFRSKKFGIHEKGWPIHDQELLAIKTALKNGAIISMVYRLMSIHTTMRAIRCFIIQTSRQ